jgi:hypothetical protein
MSGKVAAFREYGVKLRNDRYSWSGRTEDGKTVVLQLWKDHFDYKNKPVSYSDFEDPRLSTWVDRRGNLDRIEDIRWAIDHCDGRFRVVIGVAKDIDVHTRETASAYARPNILMKVVRFNELTGELHAEMVVE